MIVGVLIAVIGLVWLLAPSIPWLGKLPGNIRIEGENTRIYIPITTCILLSLLLNGIMWLARYHVPCQCWICIRDVILPCDMKDLMNKVTEAKKAAEANLIFRREEVAVMRSQTNTAKLLTDNLNVVLGDTRWILYLAEDP